jgi:hypothetical protein
MEKSDSDNIINNTISDSITSDNITSDTIILNNNHIKTYTHSDKKLLVKRIGHIKNKKCYIKIFKLINQDNLSYTKNENGIFFNLNILSDDILTKIEQIILYYENIKNQNEQILINKTNNK